MRVQVSKIPAVCLTLALASASIAAALILHGSNHFGSISTPAPENHTPALGPLQKPLLILYKNLIFRRRSLWPAETEFMCTSPLINQLNPNCFCVFLQRSNSLPATTDCKSTPLVPPTHPRSFDRRDPTTEKAE